MSINIPQFPTDIWDGLSPNTQRASRLITAAPDPEDWDQITAEMIATQEALIASGLGDSLKSALLVGNITDGRDIRISTGDKIEGIAELTLEATDDLTLLANGGTVILNETGDLTLNSGNSLVKTINDLAISAINRQEQILPVTFTGQTTFTLSQAPLDDSDVDLRINTVTYINGTDFTVVGTTLEWLDIEFTLDSDDKLEAVFFV